MTKMTTRQLKGALIAAERTIVWHEGKEDEDGFYRVPSQAGGKSYKVRIGLDWCECECQDFATTGKKCKHVYAVEFVIRREHATPQGVDETRLMMALATGVGTQEKLGKLRKDSKKRKTFKRPWAAINQAQTAERELFLKLLFDLCQWIPMEKPRGPGRPRVPVRDAVFVACLKVYSRFSSRRFYGLVNDAQEKGYLTTKPHYNFISVFLNMAKTAGILRQLIQNSSRPLSTFERDFAADATGFTKVDFRRWHISRGKQEHDWVKAHMICGVVTNIVFDVIMTEGDASESPLLPELLKPVARYCDVRDVVADKGYASVENAEAVVRIGGTPYIAYKLNHNGQSAAGIWNKMFHFFHGEREMFLKHYHKRSNAETVFQMVKTKFGGHVKSKMQVAVLNEVLCKFICHNICVLIQEMHELNIDPQFPRAMPATIPMRG